MYNKAIPLSIFYCYKIIFAQIETYIISTWTKYQRNRTIFENFMTKTKAGYFYLEHPAL